MARLRESSVAFIRSSYLDQIDDFINDLQALGRSIEPGMEILTQTLAFINQAEAQRLSRGPVDPQMRMTRAAWKLPVRRITGRYFKGWKHKRIKRGLWMVYNDSREAYFIEYGIHPTGSPRKTPGGTNYTMRVRRPVGKLSVIKTLRFADTSRISERVFETVLEPMRPGRTYRTRGAGISMSGMTSRLGYLQRRGI